MHAFDVVVVVVVVIDVCSVSDLLENESNNGSMITANTFSSSNHGIIYSNEGNQITLDGYTFVCATIIQSYQIRGYPRIPQSLLHTSACNHSSNMIKMYKNYYILSTVGGGRISMDRNR